MTAQAGDTIESKRALRRELRRQRAALGAAQRQRAASIALRRLCRMRAWHQARDIGVYLATGSEMPTDELIEQALRHGKRVWVPRVAHSNHMHFVALHARSTLRPNRYGIPEPVGRPRRTRLQDLDLLLVPVVGFDRRGYRLGAGGGFYDRWLSRRPAGRPLCMAWALALQELPAVPRDPWDQRLDGIVTERGVKWPTG